MGNLGSIGVDKKCFFQGLVHLKEQVLGICLGMQLLTKSISGWIEAQTMSFKDRIDKNYRVPHMGWNLVNKSNDSLLTKDFIL